MRERLYKLLQDSPYLNVLDDEHWSLAVDHLLSKGVIVPPCKVGQTVYKVVSDKRVKHPYEYKVIGLWYSADERCNDAHLAMYIYGVFASSIIVPFDEFGKTVFLTKEEAEKALAEREGKE